MSELKWSHNHCVESVHIRSFSGPYFPTFGLNTVRYGVSLRIQPEYGEIWTRKTPNTETFHAVNILRNIFTDTTVILILVIISQLRI